MEAERDRERSPPDARQLVEEDLDRVKELAHVFVNLPYGAALRPKAVESRWQRTWEEEGLYNAEPGADAESLRDHAPAAEHLRVAHDRPLPPALARGRARPLAPDARLQHALPARLRPRGISTWAAIGRELAKEGKTQRDLGREGFDKYAWDWLERYGGTIMQQFRLLGASLDYRRERFTMDDAYYAAVMRWFVHLYERGWIYRGNRIVNWCPRDLTALSDLEVEHEDADDALVYVRYPLADGSGDVTIATVRPATILADVAVGRSP
jgi:valyl-tRNA synthetase